MFSKELKQFISYFFVGGAAAVVEWLVFFSLVSFFDSQYLLATALAFVASTTVNWLLGRRFTFKNADYKGKRLKELLLVFLVSAIGLAFNMLLMYLFVDIFRMNSNIMKTIAKILSTGTVFIWNYLARKHLIYK